MRAFAIASRKTRQHGVTINRFLKTATQSPPLQINKKNGRDLDQSLHQAFPASNGPLDPLLPGPSKPASFLDTIFLSYNTLIHRSSTGDRLATHIALQLHARQHITSIEDARAHLARAWNLVDQISEPVARMLSVRIVQVFCRLGGTAYIDSALELFAALVARSNDKPEWSKASRDIARALTSIPPKNPLFKSRTRCLEMFLAVVSKHGLALKEHGYSTILSRVPLSPRMLMLIRQDADGREALKHRRPLPRQVMAPKQSTIPVARKDAISNKAYATHLVALSGAKGSRYARRHLYLLTKGKPKPTTDSPLLNDTQENDLLHLSLRQFIQTKTRPTQSLLALLEKLEKADNDSLLNVPSYTMFLKALMERKEWKAAWDVWVRLRTRCFRDAREQPVRSRAWRLDPMALSIGVTLLCRHRADFAEAFRMVDGLGSVESYVAASVGIPVDTFLINGLMEELSRAHRTEAIYPLWQEMSRQYGVERDNVTLRTLLDAAVLGSVGGETDASMGGIEGIATAMADGFTRMIIARRQRKRARTADLTQARFAYRMEVMLSEGRHPRDEVLWDGMVAWQRARLIFLEVALGNWPGLVNVESPASADAFTRGLRSNKPAPRWTQPTARDLLTPPSTALPVHQHIEFQSSTNPHIIPSPPSTCLYPHITLDDAIFQAYIRLLGEHSLATQIPLTLAWMRALRITPSKKTLSLSLAYFREVTTSMQPLVYAYGKEGSGEYGRLVRWLEEWVPRLVPEEDAIVTAWTRAKRKRELAELWDN